MRFARAVLFWAHLAVGCVAGLVILAMSVTGVLLAFERQINAVADAPAVLQGQSDSEEPASLDLLMARLKSDGQGEPSELVLHNNSNAPVEARFGRERTLYLNPWTGEVVGQPSEATRAFFGAVERIHRSLGLGMQSAFGRGMTGAANLAFLFMLLSGLYLWLPKVFKRTSLKSRILFGPNLRGRAREWNWHHVFGIWTVVPLFFIVFTGVIMSYPWASNLLYTMTGTQAPAGGGRGDRGPRGTGSDQRTLHGDHFAPPDSRTLDDLTQIAKQQVSGWRSMVVEVPHAAERTLVVSVDKSMGGEPEQVSQLVLNRESGHVDSMRRFSDNSAGRKLRGWARFLHTGEEFGVAGETIAAIACFGAVFLVWTGPIHGASEVIGCDAIGDGLDRICGAEL
ncbi:MAG: PepSY-associated TM helix domain-containing protein [Terracidiphilus sp.]